MVKEFDTVGNERYSAIILDLTEIVLHFFQDCKNAVHLLSSLNNDTDIILSSSDGCT